MIASDVSTTAHKKTVEVEILKEAVDYGRAKKWIARSNVSVRRARPAGWQDRRSAVRTDDAELVAEIREAIIDLPSYGYRRVWGVIRSNRERHGAGPGNVDCSQVLRAFWTNLSSYGMQKPRHSWYGWQRILTIAVGAEAQPCAVVGLLQSVRSRLRNFRASALRVSLRLRTA